MKKVIGFIVIIGAAIVFVGYRSVRSEQILEAQSRRYLPSVPGERFKVIPSDRFPGRFQVVSTTIDRDSTDALEFLGRVLQIRQGVDPYDNLFQNSANKVRELLERAAEQAAVRLQERQRNK